ncbi:MAG: MFS transporter [Reyranella sp.]|jgi:MFS family permease|uniref:MFS transporter n=1 Tax=Reyranella sp. TaxID=1929291 RepID=UPI0025CB8A07|nr:MFS transporter [Reyranella sp.]MBR2816638.1 MFS transporter [Reyranella sp.]
MTPHADIDSRKAWVVAWAALAILTLCYGAPLVSVVALKPMAAELAAPRSGPAAAGALTYLGAAFGGIVAGWLSGRLGIRRIVLFGAVMMAAGLAVSASGGLFHLYAGHGVLMGLFGTSCMFAPLITYVSRWFERRRGAAVALISSGQSVAGAIWPPLLQLGIDRFGWRWTMVLFGGLVVVAVVALTITFLHSPPDAAGPNAASATARRSTASLGLSPNTVMVLLMVAVFCCCVPMAVPMQHIVAFCGDLGFASQYGAALLSVLLGSAFLARLFWGWLADRIGGVQTLLWSSLAQATALIGFLITRDQAALFAVSAAFGFGLSGLLPAYVIAIREYYSIEEANWRIPTVLFAGLLGMAAGGWGAGLLYDRFASYMSAFSIGMVFNALNLGVLFFLVLRQRGPRRFALTPG